MTETLDQTPSQTPSRTRSRTLSQRIVGAASAALASRSSRRGFLARSALVGSALATDPIGFVLKPGTAYASVCGPSAGCNDGFTVFCCTVNGGLNACPSGTLPAGWWKADNASICGGGARYYIDCNSSCSCSSGCSDGFCDSSCWSCSCRCGSSSTCDQRRVCCNVFRYGQCHQEVACVGAIACRVVSCLPPYRVTSSCSTASATDNATVAHSAPCNLNSWGAIAAHYYAIGGMTSPLGTTAGGQYAVPGGLGASFRNGKMYAASDTGAHYLRGAILEKYRDLRGSSGLLGFPTTDELPAAGGGRFNYFEGGMIVWSPSTGAKLVRGPIADRYVDLDGSAGPLGFPTSDEYAAAGGGAFNYFQGGLLVYSPATGARAVLGPIADKYVDLRGSASVLGFPISDQYAAAGGGFFNYFQHGMIVWSPATGARFLHEEIAAKYVDLRGSASYLGFPRSDELPATGGGRFNYFERGMIVWSPATGAHAIGAAISARYADLRGSAGLLRFPTADEVAAPGGGRSCRFEGGAVYWSAATGAHWLRGPILARYLELDGPAGRLGYPVTDEYAVPGGVENRFQGGYLTLDSSTGRVTVRYT